MEFGPVLLPLIARGSQKLWHFDVSKVTNAMLRLEAAPDVS